MKDFFIYLLISNQISGSQTFMARGLFLETLKTRGTQLINENIVSKAVTCRVARGW